MGQPHRLLPHRYGTDPQMWGSPIDPCPTDPRPIAVGPPPPLPAPLGRLPQPHNSASAAPHFPPHTHFRPRRSAQLPASGGAALPVEALPVRRVMEKNRARAPPCGGAPNSSKHPKNPKSHRNPSFRDPKIPNLSQNPKSRDPKNPQIPILRTPKPKNPKFAPKSQL